MIVKVISPYPSVEGEVVLQKNDESHIVDIYTALIGLVDLMKVRFSVVRLCNEKITT